MGQWQREHKLVLSPETHVSETLLTHANKHRKALEWHTKRWGQRFKQIVSWPTLSHDYVLWAFMSIAPLAHWQRQQSWQADIMTWQSVTWLNSRYPRLQALRNLCTLTVKIWGYGYINPDTFENGVFHSICSIYTSIFKTFAKVSCPLRNVGRCLNHLTAPA